MTGAADRARGRRSAAAVAAGPAMEVTSVTVLPAGEEPTTTTDGVSGIDMTQAIHDLDPNNPTIRPNTTPWRGEDEPNPLELLVTQ